MIPVITVKNLSKRFVIERRHRRSAHQVVEDALRAPARLLSRAFGKAPAPPREVQLPREDKLLWALRNVSFQVGEGEVVGLVGRNGAGKSVLLKILSRVTPPTSGRIEIRGGVAPLLEVGTGFHPDLTGRQNIYFNGTVLGMAPAEVHRRVDQIVDFSGVEEFLDTPVRFYSNGMRLRLAFGVAAHLDRDIFLLDEVMAVGDAGFREKCMDRLQELVRQGRTILFVSHGDELLEKLCTRAILLDHGRLVAMGKPHGIYREYENLRRHAGVPV
jgi:lipopolysaccharide transport system ATP-binding protein